MIYVSEKACREIMTHICYFMFGNKCFGIDTDIDFDIGAWTVAIFLRAEFLSRVCLIQILSPRVMASSVYLLIVIRGLRKHTDVG